MADVPYTTFEYLYPPRPENAIVPEHLQYYENKKWCAQYKKNGTCSIFAISPAKEVIAMNRYGESHRQWRITAHIKKELIRLFPENSWFVIVAEILDAKTKTIKDTIFIHDVLVWESKFLYGSTFEDRQKLLDSRLVTNVESQTHYVCDSEGKVWYAKRFEKGFAALFKNIKDTSIDEGLVLKNPKGKLRFCIKSDSNSGWSVKCRHETKNYAY